MGSGHMASAPSLSSSLEGTLASFQDVEIVGVRAVERCLNSDCQAS